MLLQDTASSLEIHLGLTCVAGAHAFNSPSATIAGALAGSWIGDGEARTQTGYSSGMSAFHPN